MQVLYASLITFFYENRYSAFSALSEIHSNFFLISLISRGIIYRRVKKLEGGISDAPSRSFQMRMRPEVMVDTVEIVGQSP